MKTIDWPQLLHVSEVETSVKLIALLALQHTFCLFQKKMHFKILNQLMNYKPENRNPCLLTDFDNIKDSP